jgi:hypothetical protein
MRAVLLILLFLITASSPALAANDSRAFPPDGCSTTSPFMGFTGINGSNTFCNSGQDVLDNALPTCGEGEQIVRSGGKFICKPQVNVPSCTPGTFLSFDGANYTCQSTGVATCNDNQVLTFNGSSYFCVNKDASIPVCSANQFLTYNGSYQCAAVVQPTIPNCPSGYYLTGNGTSLSCAALPATLGEKAWYGSDGLISSIPASGPACASSSDHAFCPDGWVVIGSDMCNLGGGYTAAVYCQRGVK